MLSNVRRKRVQRLDINSYGQKDICWFKDVLVYGAQCANLGSQRYSKQMSKKSFEYYKPKPNLIPYYEINNEIYNLIPCPSGIFIRGSNDKSDTNPLEEMKIEKSFLLGETEITQELYYAVMGGNPSSFQGNPKRPMGWMSWYDALIFCNKLSDMFKFARYYRITKDGQSIDTIEDNQKNYVVETNEESKGFRLPTEWEWEYAAKAGTDLEYSGSDDPNKVAWYAENSDEGTHEVKGKIPNAWGFYDMSGNVREWCENKYKSTSAYRVARGGGWRSYASGLRSARRYGYSPSDRLDDLGFRVCRYI